MNVGTTKYNMILNTLERIYNDNDIVKDLDEIE